jgi:curved DNA-binding protein CbpA
MFKDYYQILEVEPNATLAEIKQAYRSQSLKWHPDRNKDVDTTKIMQDINEAYSILKDVEKRQRYDREYQRFKHTQQTNSQTSDNRTHSQQSTQSQSHRSSNNRTSWTYDYTVHDEQVENDMADAREYARKLVDAFLKGLKENTSKAAKGAWEEMQGYVWAAIILTIIGLIIMATR